MSKSKSLWGVRSESIEFRAEEDSGLLLLPPLPTPMRMRTYLDDHSCLRGYDRRKNQLG